MNKLTTPAGDVSVVFDGPDTSKTLIVLAHGAGSDLRADFMEEFARGLADEGFGVARFNFAYMEQGKKAPDRQPVLEETYRSVLDQLVAEHAPDKVAIGGKSLGGRIASHTAAGGGVDALVYLGYPLHPPGRPDRIRDGHLRELDVPMLFVEGTRDPFCPLDTLGQVRKSLRAANEVFVVEDGDHSLKVRKSSGRSTAEAWAQAIAGVAAWLEKTLS